MCTSLRLTADDGSVVVGRTSEYALPVAWDLVVVPVGTTGRGSSPVGPGRTWRAQHASVGIAVAETSVGGVVLPAQPSVIDGVNDAGLWAGLLYLPHVTRYPDPDGVAAADLLGPSEVASYVLATCATVDEALAAFDDVVVWAAPTPVVGVPPLQLVLHDRTGAAGVVDWVDGECRARDNPLGVATNSPPLEWHLANLGNYVHLAPDGRPPLLVDGVALPPTGEGSGFLGMPGDMTPPSRFVRAAMCTAFARTGEDSGSTAAAVQHVMNSFDIPKGMVRVAAHSGPQSAIAHGLDEHTVWTVVAELADGPTYRVRTYDDPAWRHVRLPEAAAADVVRRPLGRHDPLVPA
jgi:choloylglycine hydrolase